MAWNPDSLREDVLGLFVDAARHFDASAHAERATSEYVAYRQEYNATWKSLNPQRVHAANLRWRERDRNRNKECAKCRASLPKSSFRKGPGVRCSNYCNACRHVVRQQVVRLARARWRERNLEKHAASVRKAVAAHYTRNRDRILDGRRIARERVAA